jgi:hypothetical protein
MWSESDPANEEQRHLPAINTAEQASKPPPDGGSPDMARFLRTQQCVRNG